MKSPRTFPVPSPAFVVAAISAAALLVAAAQQRPDRGRREAGPPPPRQHTANTTAPLRLKPAIQEPPEKSEATFGQQDKGREIRANGLPDHRVGKFPNPGNPNEIASQGYDIVIASDPKPEETTTAIPGPFGIALNGVVFDPGAAEFWRGIRDGGWTYEALGGAVPLGIDENHAHVQPNGSYHYHGLPTLYLKQRGVAADRHSPQIGWAADGFPIYALYGHRAPKESRSPIVKLRSSYRLKKGDRPQQPDAPGGSYDGAFVQDYEYVEGGGDLDECNGRFCITPEFPQGTYAYFLTEAFPVIPRLFRGTPVSFRKQNRRPPPGPGGPPPRPPLPPPPR